MSSINELLQLFWRTEATAGSKETRHMVTERTIIGVFLDSHHLDAVITILDNTWQNIVLKLCIGTHLLGILSHTYMALIDEQRILLRLEVLLFPLIGFLRVPNLSREYLCLIILYYALTPSRDTLSFPTVPLYLHLVQLTVFQSFF